LANFEVMTTECLKSVLHENYQTYSRFSWCL